MVRLSVKVFFFNYAVHPFGDYSQELDFESQFSLAYCDKEDSIDERVNEESNHVEDVDGAVEEGENVGENEVESEDEGEGEDESENEGDNYDRNEVNSEAEVEQGDQDQAEVIEKENDIDGDVADVGDQLSHEEDPDLVYSQATHAYQQNDRPTQVLSTVDKADVL